MALAALLGLEVEQMDAVATFLNGKIEGEVSIEIPLGHTQNREILRLLVAKGPVRS